MRRIYVISDTHFGHANIIRYCNRPFASVEAMDECLADNWTDVVRAQDIVYHCGDVYMGRVPAVLERLSGRKRLILGNHDNGKDQILLRMFQKVMVWRMFPHLEVLLSHVPIHESSLKPGMVNIHGHIHEKAPPTERHVNVSVEQTGYRPIDLEEVAANAVGWAMAAEQEG